MQEDFVYRVFVTQLRTLHPLAALALLHTIESQLTDLMAEHARLARDQGHTWADIARATGLHPKSAQRRLHRPRGTGQ